jgi:hypothetical protein
LAEKLAREAADLHEKRKYADSVRLWSRILEIQRKYLGEENPRAANSYSWSLYQGCVNSIDQGS